MRERAMPRDKWKRANDRSRFGPVRSLTKEEKSRKNRQPKPPKPPKRVPANFKKAANLYVVYAGTNAKVVRPDGSIVEFRTRKNLRFGSEANKYREEGCLTFHRFGHYLIVPVKLVGRQSSGP